MLMLSPRATEQIAGHPLFETAALCLGALMQAHYPGRPTVSTPQDMVDALQSLSEPPIRPSELLSDHQRRRLYRYADDMARPTAGDYPARCVGFLLQEIAGSTEGLPGAPSWPITTGTVRGAIVADPRWSDVAPKLAALVDEPGETDPEQLFYSLYLLGERYYDPDGEAFIDDPAVMGAVELRLDGGYGRDFVDQWFEDATCVLA